MATSSKISVEEEELAKNFISMIEEAFNSDVEILEDLIFDEDIGLCEETEVVSEDYMEEFEEENEDELFTGSQEPEGLFSNFVIPIKT
jgi:hypothetical protein